MDLGRIERNLGAVGHLDDVVLPGRLVAVDQLAHHPAAAGQHKNIGRRGCEPPRESIRIAASSGEDRFHS